MESKGDLRISYLLVGFERNSDKFNKVQYATWQNNRFIKRIHSNVIKTKFIHEVHGYGLKDEWIVRTRAKHRKAKKDEFFEFISKDASLSDKFYIYFVESDGWVTFKPFIAFDDIAFKKCLNEIFTNYSKENVINVYELMKSLNYNIYNHYKSYHTGSIDRLDLFEDATSQEITLFYENYLPYIINNMYNKEHINIDGIY